MSNLQPGEARLSPDKGAGDCAGQSATRRMRGKRWTASRMAAFLRALRDTQSVALAAAQVGMGRQSAYKLRRRLAGQPFALAWDMAFELEGALPRLARVRRCPGCGAAPTLPRGASSSRSAW